MTERTKLTKEKLYVILRGTTLTPYDINDILEDQEKAQKLDKLIDDLNSRRESNIKQREIELKSKSGSKAFAYQLEWGIDLISAILNYDFYKGRNHLELEQEIKQLRRTAEQE